MDKGKDGKSPSKEKKTTTISNTNLGNIEMKESKLQDAKKKYDEIYKKVVLNKANKILNVVDYDNAIQVIIQYIQDLQENNIEWLGKYHDLKG